MTAHQLVPGAEPYFLAGGPTACLLIHGFTSSPEESRPLGEDLQGLGWTALGIRLAGHGTQPRDLARVRAEDWLADLEDGFALLSRSASRVVLVGQSLGACLALTAAARLPVAGVIAISAPSPGRPSLPRKVQGRLREIFQPIIRKQGTQPHPLLGARREADYPAYREFPARVLRELARAQEWMAASLGEVRAPVLLLQSRDDPFLDPLGPPRILAELGSTAKQLAWLDGLGHSLTNHPGRAEALEVLVPFLERCAGGRSAGQS